MPKYEVVFRVTKFATAIVEAADEEEARDKAASLDDSQYKWEEADWETADLLTENPCELPADDERVAVKPSRAPSHGSSRDGVVLRS